MTDTSPFIAIVGGLSHLASDQLAAAKEAGRTLGEELAKAGFRLVVYYSDEYSLEPHVVRGYVPNVVPSQSLVRVRYAESQRGQVKFEQETEKPEVFEHRLFPGPDWEAPFYRSLAEEDGVDAVLLLGGAASTLIAGQIAVARNLPILPVDEFGGAAAKIWNQLASAAPDRSLPSWRKQQAASYVARLKSECMAASLKAKEARKRDELVSRLRSQSRNATYGAGVFLCLLVALFFGMIHTPSVAGYPILMFGGLIAAGATGAIVRTLLTNSGETDPNISLLLGGIAGFAVGLAYLIPQWVGAPGVLQPRAEAVTATDKIQFASAVLVAISAGIGFDTVFNRLQKQAQDAPLGPPPH